MVISKKFLLVVAATALVASPRVVLLRAQAATEGGTHQGFGGVWVISPDAQLRGPDTASVPSGGSEGGRRHGGGGGGRGGGGYGAGGGARGGHGGGGYSGGAGRGGAPGEEAAEERQAMAEYSRTLLQPVKQMTIVPHDGSLAIAYDDGRTLTLEATNKKVSGRAENGFVKYTRKSKWEGDAMVSEVAIENGPTFVEKYELIADGTQLRVSITSKGGAGKDTERTITHVYERPVE
jgi:hypothetical protein